MGQIYFQSAFKDQEVFFEKSVCVDIERAIAAASPSELRKWIEKNCEETVFIETRPLGHNRYYKFYFDSEADATAFKLRWQ